MTQLFHELNVALIGYLFFICAASFYMLLRSAKYKQQIKDISREYNGNRALKSRFARFPSGRWKLGALLDLAQSRRFYRSLSEGSIRYFHNGIYVSARQRVCTPTRERRSRSDRHLSHRPCRRTSGRWSVQRTSCVEFRGCGCTRTRAALPSSAPLNAAPHRNCDCVSGNSGIERGNRHYLTIHVPH